MENFKKFRSKATTGGYDWSIRWSWSDGIKPDLGVVWRHYAGPGGGCVQYTDGQVLKQTLLDVKSSNGSAERPLPLAGHQVGLMGFPFYFGYEGYFVMESSSPGNESINLWCGQIPSLLTAAMKQSGAQVVFRQIPSTLWQLIEWMLIGTDLLCFGMGGTQAVYQSPVNVLRRGPFMDAPEAGNMITHKIYARRVFAFLGTFTLESWLVILAAMLVLSLVTSLAGRCRPTDKNKRAYKWPGQTIGGHDALLRDWPGMTLEFGGVLWGQGMSTLDRYHRGLTSLWLLACTVLVGCLSGSLRDMMSTATQVLVPQVWDDLWSSPWRKHTLATIPGFEALSELEAKFGKEAIAELDAQDRLWVLPSERHPLPKIASDPIWYLKRCIDMSLDPRRNILLIFRRFFLAASWLVHVVRSLAVETLAYLYDETLQEADDRVTAYLAEAYQHVAISPGQTVMHTYFTYIKFVPRQVELYVDKFLVKFRDNGMASLMTDRTDERIQSKILTHQTAKASAEVLMADDLAGPLVLYWAFLLCGFADFVLERFYRARLMRRVHITSQ